jgi:hypothetical protein
MTRLVTLLATALVTALVLASSASARSLQPPLPPDARGAQKADAASDTPAVVFAGGIAALLAGAALVPLSRGRRTPAPA